MQTPTNRGISFPTVLPPIDLAFHLIGRRNGFSNFYSSLANLMNLNPYVARSLLNQFITDERKDQETPLDLSAKKFKSPLQFDLAMQMFAKVDSNRRMPFQNPFENFQNNHSQYPVLLPPLLQSHHHHHLNILHSMSERSGNNSTPQNNIISPTLSKNSLNNYKNKTNRIVTNLSASKSSRRTSGGGKQPVTSCLQCSTSFASLIDLNTHFLNEHELCLIKELELAKSWKSHAVEEICMQVKKKYITDYLLFYLFFQTGTRSRGEARRNRDHWVPMSPL